MMRSVKISPSMLSADFKKMGDELQNVIDAGADTIHWDVMDGSFVNAISFGAEMISTHRKMTSLRFDVHLMVENPEKHIPCFALAGADLIVIHAEATKHLHRALSMIKSEGKLAGVAFNPGTDIDCLPYIKDVTDAVVIMTVDPGASGQRFIASQLRKIAAAREIFDGEICVDGGINLDTISPCYQAGADTFVSGSFLFKSDDYAATIQRLKVCAEK